MDSEVSRTKTMPSSSILSDKIVRNESDDHVKRLEKLDDKSEKKMFSIDNIKNLDVFIQNPRLFIRLKMCLDQNNYYEAHQAYKTLHFR